MNLARRLYEWENRRGVRKLLRAKREDPQKWDEILETKDNADIDRADVIDYLRNQGRPKDIFTPSIAGILPSAFIGILSAMAAQEVNRSFGLNLDESIVLPIFYFGSGVSTYSYLISYLIMGLESKPYFLIRKEALENIAQKKYWGSYKDGGAD